MAAQQTHNLFVVVGGTDGARAATIRVLQFMAHAKPWLERLGVTIAVHKIRPEMLQDPRLCEALRAKGITDLPAVKTPRKLFLGITQITQSYSAIIAEFRRTFGDSKTDAAIARREQTVPGGASGEDIYRDYYAADLSFTAADSDQGDEPMSGSGDGMMKQLQSMMARRKTIDASRQKKSGAFVSGAGAPARAPGTGDNVADDDLIDRLITTTTVPVTQHTLDVAFGAGEGAEDAREDLMIRAFWENQEESI